MPSLFEQIFGDTVSGRPSDAEIASRVNDAYRRGLEKGFQLCKDSAVEALKARHRFVAADQVQAMKLGKK